MTPQLRALFGASLAALAAAPALAQEGDADTKSDIIVTAEQAIEQAIQEVEKTPGGADVVPAGDYADKVAVSLRDALAFSPGVYAQPRFAQEVRLSVRGSGIGRGYHMRGLTLLQDGIPINLADDNGDFQELDPTLLQHLEVFRGANALRFGASTLGGAINGVTPTGRTTNGLTLRIDGGSFDTVRALAAYGLATERGDGYLVIAGDRSDGDRAHSDREALRVNANVGIRLTDRIETRFYFGGQTIFQNTPDALNASDVEERPESGDAGNFTGRDIDSMRVSNRTRFDLGGGTLDVGAFMNIKELYHPIFQIVDYTYFDWGAYSRVDYGTGPLTLSAGATARFGSVDAKRYVNVQRHRGALTSQADQVARTIDLYGEARFRPIEPLQLIAGAVYTSGLRRQDRTFPTAATGRGVYDEVSPKLGVIYEPAETIQLYANYSRSHELPGFIELVQFSPFLPDGSFVPLDPQRGWTAEIGGRGTIGPVRFDVSVYRADLEGELLQFNTDPVNVPASTFNAGPTRHQGIEAGLDIDLAPWARLRQAYQYNDFTFRGDAQFGDNRLPVIPAHLYRAELRLGTDRLHVAPNVEWIPEGAWADYANSFRAEGYAMIGLTAAAAIDDRFELFVDARNLTQETAIGDIGAVVAYTPGSAIFYPVERRAVYGGVRVRLP